MLKIINDLQPFIEDCYREINVREYAKIAKISPPTASKQLMNYAREGVLLKTAYRNNLLFQANQESKLFVDLARMYWKYSFRDLVIFLEKNLLNPTIILFGSLAKAEAKGDSDVDLAVFAQKKAITLTNFEKKFKRNIQILWFQSIKEIKSKELANNIVNGYVLSGRLRIS